MPKPIKQAKRPKDVNHWARQMVAESTQTVPDSPDEKKATPTRSEISRVMAAMGRRGGKIGGKRRMVTMTPEQRRNIAIKAARRRWDGSGKSS